MMLRHQHELIVMAVVSLKPVVSVDAQVSLDLIEQNEMSFFSRVRAQVNELGRGFQVLNMVFQIDELASAESVQLRDAVIVCHDV